MARKPKKGSSRRRSPVRIAGRIVGLRRFGKAAFAVLQDGSDRLQVYLKKDTLGEQAYQISEGLDLGDWIGVTGILFRTKTNEFTVEVQDPDLPQQSASSPAGKVARPDRCRDALPAAVCGPDRQSRSASDFRITRSRIISAFARF